MMLEISNRIKSLKNSFYKFKFKILGAKIPPGAKFFGKPNYIGNLKNLKIGSGSTINHGVFFNCANEIKIGANCRISTYSQFHTGALFLSSKLRRDHYSKPIELYDDVWISAGVIINPGVKIGRGSVIAPGSVVTKSIPENEFHGGVPARFLKKINEDEL